MDNLHELFTLLAGFLATAFALLRTTIAQSKGFSEQLVKVLETSIEKQDESLNEFRASLDHLSENVHENSLVIRQVAEWLQVSTPVGGSR